MPHLCVPSSFSQQPVSPEPRGQPIGREFPAHLSCLWSGQRHYPALHLPWNVCNSKHLRLCQFQTFRAGFILREWHHFLPNCFKFRQKSNRSHASSWTLCGAWEKNIGSFHLMVSNPAGTGSWCLLETWRGRAGEVVQASPPQVAAPFVSPCSAPWQVMRDKLGTCPRRVWHRQ